MRRNEINLRLAAIPDKSTIYLSHCVRLFCLLVCAVNGLHTVRSSLYHRNENDETKKRLTNPINNDESHSICNDHDGMKWNSVS